jgi:hypothetical protein
MGPIGVGFARRTAADRREIERPWTERRLTAAPGHDIYQGRLDDEPADGRTSGGRVAWCPEGGEIGFVSSTTRKSRLASLFRPRRPVGATRKRPIYLWAKE